MMIEKSLGMFDALKRRVLNDNERKHNTLDEPAITLPPFSLTYVQVGWRLPPLYRPSGR